MYTIMTRQWKKMAPLLCKTLAVWMCVCITTTSAVDSFETCEDLKGLIQIQENETKNTTIMEVESVSCLSIDSPKNLVTAEKSGDTKWVIKLLSTLDLEKTKTKEYTIDFKCCDAGDDRSYSYSLTMAVIGVNDFPPVFSAPNTTISIPESTEVGKIVYEMGTSNPANDPDFGGTNYIVYKVVKGPTDVFDINDNLKGTIQLKQNLDFETNQAYELEISGEEGNTKIKMTATTTLYIKITDVDDLNPRFIDLNYQLQIPEGDYKTIEPNCFLTVPPIKAEDGDRSLDEDISFALAEENDAFSIQENGTLCVQEKIGRGVYFVNIKAMQKNNPEFRLALTVVKLTVTDVNDNPPVIGHAQYKARVSENAAIGSIVLALSATDQDEGDNAEFEFKLEGEESEPFTIETNLNQGVVKTAKVLDRENKDVYKFKVFAQETKTKERRKSKISDVTVSVIDVNDNAPLFAATNNVDILENAPEGTSLIKVTATDKDDGEAGKVTYSLLNSPSSNHFMINNETGEISLKCSDCLNYSETKDITLIVQAQDNGKPPRSSLTSIPVTVVQTKFSAPEFTQSVYSVSVQENDQPKVLMQLRALDPDSLESDLVYSLDPLDNHLISMIKVEQNGQIRSLVSFDAETKSFFKFGVRVSDGHREDNARVEVTVNDVNEFRPKIVMTSLKNISENATIGTVVTYFNVTDKDESNKGFTSAWLDAGSEGKFRLDLNSSSIVTSALLDRKAKSVYTMNIYVSDYGQPPKSSHKELQVVVIDSNTSPVFINENSDPVSSYTFSVNENVSVGFNVGSLRVFDPDNGSSGRIEYHLISVTPSDDFGLDPMSGDLTVKKILNFEKCEVYDITVRARDHSLLPKSIDATVRINIRDVAELPVWPSTNRQVYLTQSEVCNNRNVSHISKWTKEVTVLFAQSDEKIGYYLTNMTSQFSLEETTGLLVNNRKLKAGPYVLGVEACSDNRDSRVCSEAAVTVVVESDSLLTFCQGFYRESVSESKPTGTDILQFTVNKKDDSISYSILRGNDDGSFEVSEETGFLKTAKPLDREKLARYEMVVLAESSSEKAEAQVIIEILDEPDSPPQFSTNHYKAQVPENFASDSEPVLTVTAFDPDQNALISYSLDNDVNGMFKIDQKGHVFVIKSMDYETMAHVYTVTVSATDSIFTTNATVIITVTDVNDESPVFEGLDSTWSVPENVTIPHFMFQVKATDADTNDRIIYSMNMVHPNNTANPFVIHPFSGRLEVRTVLDREQTSDYTLEITAEDTAGHNTTTTVSMSVTDVNDNHPTFGKATFVMNVTEAFTTTPTTTTTTTTTTPQPTSTPQLITTPQPNTTTPTTPELLNSTSKQSTHEHAHSHNTTRSPIRHDFTCDISRVSIKIPVNLLPNSKLTLKDPSCVLRDDGRVYSLQFQYDQCGSNVLNFDSIVVIENEINVEKDFGTIRAPIQFDTGYKIPITCSVNRSVLLQGVIETVTRDSITEIADQSARMKYSMKEFKTEAYTEEITANPVKIPINREVFFELSSNESLPNMGIEIQECIATPSHDPQDQISYALMKNGCPQSPAVHQVSSSTIFKRRFKVQAFHFSGQINYRNRVYFHCRVRYCVPSHCSRPACSGGNRTARSLRRRRGVTLEQTRDNSDEGTYISFGPLHVV